MKAIIKKYLQGQLNDLEQLGLLKWLRTQGNLDNFNEIKNDWIKEKRQENLTEEEKNSLIRFQEQMLSRSHSRQVKMTKLNRLTRYAAIFMVFLLIGGGAAIFSRFNILTNPSISTLIAKGGQISTVILPDSTIVWINSNSKLTYNHLYGKKNRNVTIDGQAFFQVTKNKKIPFVVNSHDVNIEVTGTIFDVEAYSDAPITTIVLHEGSVNVSFNTLTKNPLSLHPGEQLIFNSKNKRASISRANMEKIGSWKNGILNIYDLPLKEAARKLENRYNYKFQIEEEIEDLNVTITLRDEDLTDMLQILKTIIPISISTKNDSIEIKSRK